MKHNMSYYVREEDYFVWSSKLVLKSWSWLVKKRKKGCTNAVEDHKIKQYLHFKMTCAWVWFNRYCVPARSSGIVKYLCWSGLSEGRGCWASLLVASLVSFSFLFGFCFWKHLNDWWLLFLHWFDEHFPVMLNRIITQAGHTAD